MPTLLERARIAGQTLFAKPALANGKRVEGPPGNFSTGSGFYGGPLFTDHFASKRAPSAWQLVEAYKSLIYACVMKNANAVARVPLRLYIDKSKSSKPVRSLCDPHPISRRTFDRFRNDPHMEYCRVAPGTVEDIAEIREHPLLWMMDHSDPWGYFNRISLISLIVRYVDVIGTAYVAPEPLGSLRMPQWLWPLFSQYVYPLRRMGSALVEHYQYFADILPFDQIMRFRLTNSLRDPYAAAYSPTYAALEYANLEDIFVSIQEQVLMSGPRPNLVFSAKDPLQSPGEYERQRFSGDLNRQLSGANAGKALVTSGAWDITPVNVPTIDTGAVALSEYDMQRVCNCFGIPPSIMTTETNIANTAAAREIHAVEAVEPRCHMIASTLTWWSQLWGDDRLFWAFDSAVPEDEERRAKIDDIKLKNGSATINFVNEDSKYPPVEYGDEAWIPGSMRQPSMIQSEAQMKLTQSAASIEQSQMMTEYQFGGSEGREEEDENTEREVEEAGAEQRAIEEGAIARVIGEIEADIARWQGKGNPYHDALGKFAPGGFHGKKPREGRQPRGQKKEEKKAKPAAKKSSDQPKSKEQMTDRERKGKPAVLSEKAQRAQDNQTKTTREHQQYAKENEFKFAERLKGKAFADNGPIDVEIKLAGKTHGVELKTLTHGKNDKVTMKGEALDRKVKWEKETGGTIHTFVLDHRDKFGETADLHSGHEIYYKRGAGSFRINAMTKVRDEKHALQLMRENAK
jgi:hypothetical protein